ncbi:MAG: acetylglutamate kinase [Candidatus Hodarchaeota archaeon]
MRLIIKMGGEIVENDTLLDHVIQEIAELHMKNYEIIIVHGGGKTTSILMEKMGLKPTFVKGLRVTDEETLKFVIMTLRGLINLKIVSKLVSKKVKALGLSGVDTTTIIAEKKKVEKTLDLGLVGEVKKIDTRLIDLLLKEGIVPVFSSLCYSEKEFILNVNADEVAGALSATLKPDVFIILTDTKGVLEDPEDEESTIEKMNIKTAENLISRGIASTGMIPKLEACINALKEGTKEAIIIQGTKQQKTIKEAIINKNIQGTKITKD